MQPLLPTCSHIPKVEVCLHRYALELFLFVYVEFIVGMFVFLQIKIEECTA